MKTGNMTTFTCLMLRSPRHLLSTAASGIIPSRQVIGSLVSGGDGVAQKERSMVLAISRLPTLVRKLMKDVGSELRKGKTKGIIKMLTMGEPVITAMTQTEMVAGPNCQGADASMKHLFMEMKLAEKVGCALMALTLIKNILNVALIDS